MKIRIPLLNFIISISKPEDNRTNVEKEEDYKKESDAIVERYRKHEEKHGKGTRMWFPYGISGSRKEKGHICTWECQTNGCEVHVSKLAKWMAKADTMTKDEIAKWDFQKGVYYGYIDKDHYKNPGPNSIPNSNPKNFKL